MPTVFLSNKECALIHKAIELIDFSYAGEVDTAKAVQEKVFAGAAKYTKEQTALLAVGAVTKEEVSQ